MQLLGILVLVVVAKVKGTGLEHPSVRLQQLRTLETVRVDLVLPITSNEVPLILPRHILPRQ
jgi:hypothetical protein